MISTNISSINRSVLNSGSTQSIKSNSYASSANGQPVESPSSVTTISPEAQLANIGSRYDVTNMTEKEMGEMSKSLFDAGLISSGEAAVMSFPLDQMRKNLGIVVDESKKINYVEQYKSSLAMARQNNASPQELKMREHMVAVLDGLNSVA